MADVRLELAIALYDQHRLSLGKARELANMSLWQFRQVLAARRIIAHYDVQDLHQDLQTLHMLSSS